MKKCIEKSRDFISSLLFPLRCPVCDEILEPENIEKGIHSKCESKLYPIYGAVCMHCGRPLGNSSQEMIDYFEFHNTKEYCNDCHKKGYVSKCHPSNISRGKSLYLYKGQIKKTMYRFKYANKREYARFFAKKAVHLIEKDFDVIIPVPMYKPKQRKRGYNQAETFARELSKLTGIPLDTKSVKRIKNTTPLKELDYESRKNNLKNAFQIEKNIVQYKHVLVVDDIYTTGSTAEAVAHELKKTGVRQVHLLTICIGADM